MSDVRGAGRGPVRAVRDDGLQAHRLPQRPLRQHVCDRLRLCRGRRDSCPPASRAFPINYWDGMTPEEAGRVLRARRGPARQPGRESAVMAINPDFVDMDARQRRDAAVSRGGQRRPPSTPRSSSRRRGRSTEPRTRARGATRARPTPSSASATSTRVSAGHGPAARRHRTHFRGDAGPLTASREEDPDHVHRDQGPDAARDRHRLVAPTALVRRRPVGPAAGHGAARRPVPRAVPGRARGRAGRAGTRRPRHPDQRRLPARRGLRRPLVAPLPAPALDGPGARGAAVRRLARLAARLPGRHADERDRDDLALAARRRQGRAQPQEPARVRQVVAHRPGAFRLGQARQVRNVLGAGALDLPGSAHATNTTATTRSS